ncbi:MAG TPA: transporter [Sphingomicrobium sp.]|jgi:hypothetical protein
MKIAIHAPLGALLACWSAAAAADHPVAGAFGSGGGIIVFGPDTLERGRWAAGLRLSFTKPNQRSDEELEALAGAHVHAHDSRYNLLTSLGLAYGLTDRLMLSAELPYVRHAGLRAGEHSHSGGAAHNEVVSLGSVNGVGDLRLMAKYRLTGAGPVSAALIAGVQVPTGSTHRRGNNGERLETEHQPGSGSVDPIIGASASAPVGSLRLSGSALYHFARKGAQQTRLGDRFQAGVALSKRFGDVAEEPHHHDGDVAPHSHAAPAPRTTWDAMVEVAGEWEGRQRIGGEIEPDSGGKSLWVAPGLRFNAASGWSAGVSVGVPVWQRIRESHPENSYRVILSLARGF